MSLTEVIVSNAVLDCAVLAVLAVVMRIPFRIVRAKPATSAPREQELRRAA